MIKEYKYKLFVVARTPEESWIPQCYKEAPPAFDTLEEAEAALKPGLEIFEFDCTKHVVTRE